MIKDKFTYRTYQKYMEEVNSYVSDLHDLVENKIDGCR
jgi:hypothetical protein